MKTTELLTLAIDTSRQAARGEDFAPLLVEESTRLFSLDAGVGLFFLRPGVTFEPPRLVVGGMPQLKTAEEHECLRLIPTHPSVRAMSAAPGDVGTVRVSDVTSLRTFWGTETFEAVHGSMNGRYPASTLLHASPDLVVFLGLQRQRSDFSDTEMEQLALLQRPLSKALAFRQAMDATVRILAESSPGIGSAVRGASYRPTPREAEVLVLVARGWTSARTGRRLGITERTVRKHLEELYERTGLRGRAALTRWWTQQQWG